jgi:hypothetical protein
MDAFQADPLTLPIPPGALAMADSATPQPLYAGPIHEAISSNDRRAWKPAEARAAHHLEEVKAALAELRAALGRNS